VTEQDADESLTLPDGRTVHVTASEAATAGACLLQPALMGIAGPTVAEAAAASVFTHLDPSVRKVPSYNSHNCVNLFSLQNKNSELYF
jgi:hypothetical protein